MLFETHKVIYNGKQENAGLIGKEVYFANDLLELNLNVEKENIGSRAVLLQIDEDTLPFKVQLPSGCETWVKLIYPIPEENTIRIVKDEPENEEKKEVIDEPHYRAFNGIDELIQRWNFINPCSRPAYTMPLIWVKYKTPHIDEKSATRQLITAFTNTGVEMGAEFMTWEYFFERMEFLDGTPCGVLIE